MPLVQHPGANDTTESKTSTNTPTSGHQSITCPQKEAGRNSTTIEKDSLVETRAGFASEMERYVFSVWVQVGGTSAMAPYTHTHTRTYCLIWPRNHTQWQAHNADGRSPTRPCYYVTVDSWVSRGGVTQSPWQHFVSDRRDNHEGVGGGGVRGCVKALNDEVGRGAAG